MKHTKMVLFMGLIPFLSPAIFGQETEISPVESITEAEMRDHIYFLASDYMGGRIASSAEYEIAAQYVASQFASAGLESLTSEKGNMSGYFQQVPYEKLSYSQDMKWILHTKTGTKEFTHNKDFKILEGRTVKDEPQDVVFAGFGIKEPDYGWNDFEDIDIEGKMVIVLAGAPMKKGEAVLPDSIHQQYSTLMGLQSKLMPLIMMHPASIILILDKQTSAFIPFERFPSNFSETMYRYLGSEEGPEGLQIPMIYLVTDEVARSIFENQKYDPVDIEEDGIKKYQCYDLEDLSIETSFPLLEQKEVFLKNVVGVVKGTDPELSKEYIAVGAHLDHVAAGAGQVANGADDNASGSAGVMEIAEAVAMDPPRRSVVFIAYTAEEMGLQGSNYFVNAGPIPISDIKFNVNLDMIGRTTRENKDTRSHYVLADKKYMPALEPFIADINKETVQYPLIFDPDSRFSGSSDHASFSNAGIPAFFFFSGMHEDLHQPGDDPEKIEYDKAVKISRLAYLISMKLANMDVVPSFLE